ncbi:unnamed protein product [Closterium sp. NIES-54]
MECRPVCVRDVQRTGHDVRGRRCWFWVRYRHDNTEVRWKVGHVSCYCGEWGSAGRAEEKAGREGVPVLGAVLA